MSKTQRAPFQPLSSDIDDSLEQLARQKGVGMMVKPENSEQGPETATPSDPSPRPKRVKPPVEEATPRSQMKTVNMELPLYVWTDLKIRAAHKQTSVRHIVMTALKAAGVPIAQADMVEDGRRLRGRDHPSVNETGA